MAALQSCCFSAFSAVSSSARRLSSPTILPVGRREYRFPRLKMQPGKTAAPRRRLAARAHNRDAQPLGHPAGHFHEEMGQVMEHYMIIISVNDGYLYEEATAMSARLCLSANEALIMASDVVDDASPNLGAPNEISTETIHRTVRMYANAFSDAAKDAYNRTVNRKTIVSFLGALRGLAAVSHILLEGALEAVSHKLPRESPSEYALNSDVKAMYSEFRQQMSDLQDTIRSASAMEACELAVPTIVRGTEATGSFVGLMVFRRQRALEKAHRKLAA